MFFNRLKYFIWVDRENRRGLTILSGILWGNIEKQKYIWLKETQLTLAKALRTAFLFSRVLLLKFRYIRSDSEINVRLKFPAVQINYSCSKR